jgi:hypothetical protein
MFICNSDYASHQNTIFILLLSSSVFGNNSIHRLVRFAVTYNFFHEQYYIKSNEGFEISFRIKCYLGEISESNVGSEILRK